MRKNILKIALFSCLMFSGKSSAQNVPQQVGYLLDDALFFSDKYITPATDCAVYQSSSGWIDTPKKRKAWDVNLSLHGNLFFVPNRDRSFAISNSDFKLFTLEGTNTSATIPTALGGNTDVYFVGDIGGSPLRIAAPKGINQETVFYPYLRGSVSVGGGLEFVGKYSTKVKLKKGNYQVYGFGFKYNLDQHISQLRKKNINLALFAGYSNEEVSFDFLEINDVLILGKKYGLGINQITGYVDSYQMQLSASKEWKKFELIAGYISNLSYFKYEITGPKGSIETLIPFQDRVNDKLKEIYKKKYIPMGEISGRYELGKKLHTQATVAFGKFINTNLSIEYQF